MCKTFLQQFMKNWMLVRMMQNWPKDVSTVCTCTGTNNGTCVILTTINEKVLHSLLTLKLHYDLNKLLAGRVIYLVPLRHGVDFVGEKHSHPRAHLLCDVRDHLLKDGLQVTKLLADLKSHKDNGGCKNCISKWDTCRCTMKGLGGEGWRLCVCERERE